MNDAPFSLVGTATRRTDATTRENRPFFDFFQSQFLRPLSLDQAFDLVDAHIRAERDPALLGQSDEVRARIAAFYPLLVGRARPLMMLYETLKAGLTASLHQQLLVLLDRLSPVYLARLQQISTQMEQVLVALCLAERPLVPSELGHRCKLSTNQITANISKLAAEQLVAPGQRRDGRSRYWEVSDRLLRIWLCIREDPTATTRLGQLLVFLRSRHALHEPWPSVEDQALWRGLRERLAPRRIDVALFEALTAGTEGDPREAPDLSMALVRAAAQTPGALLPELLALYERLRAEGQEPVCPLEEWVNDSCEPQHPEIREVMQQREDRHRA